MDTKEIKQKLEFSFIQKCIIKLFKVALRLMHKNNIAIYFLDEEQELYAYNVNNLEKVQYNSEELDGFTPITEHTTLLGEAEKVWMHEEIYVKFK